METRERLAQPLDRLRAWQDRWPSRSPLTRWSDGRIGEIFGADLRSIALFRIALGLLVLIDLGGRVANLRVHYSDEGILPRDLLIPDLNPWRWSLLLANGTVAFQAAAFVLTATAALLLMLGYRARLMSVVVWILVVSIQVRNPMLLSGADTLLRVLLFWAMFLPLGATWSLDQRWAETPRLLVTTRFLSIGTAALVLQVAFMYWFTVALKWGPVWVTEGTALYYATGAAQITRPLGDAIHQFPGVLRVWTHASLVLEAAAPALLFWPWRTGPVRTAAVATIMAFHAGIFLLMDVGIFPFVSALGMVAFLPSWFWDVALPRVRVALARRLPRRLPAWRPEPLQAALAGQAVAPEPTGTARFATEDPAPAIRGAGTPPNEPVPNPAPVMTPRASLVGNLFAAFCLLIVFGWNVATASAFTMPAASRPLAYGLGLYQTWDMFAPRPPGATRWYVIRGVLQDGQEVDLLTPIVYDDLSIVRPVSWERPGDIVDAYYRDKYWRKYFDAIVGDENANERREFASYTCRTWNGRYGGDVALARVEIYTMSVQTLPDNAPAPTRRATVGEYRCN